MKMKTHNNLENVMLTFPLLVGQIKQPDNTDNFFLMSRPSYNDGIHLHKKQFS